jgi:hypothetical protein
MQVKGLNIQPQGEGKCPKAAKTRDAGTTKQELSHNEGKDKEGGVVVNLFIPHVYSLLNTAEAPYLRGC